MILHDMPRTIIKKLYVTLGVGKFNFNEINVLSFNSTKYMHDGHEEILLFETEITLELPKEINTKAHFIDVLKKRKKGIESEYRTKAKEAQDRIDRFLATGHQEPVK